MNTKNIPFDWSVKKLMDFVDILDSKRQPIKENQRNRGKYPYYGASGIIDYIDDYIFEGTFILLGEDGENILSRNLPLAYIATGKIWVNNHAHVLCPKIDTDIEFLCHYLESLNYTKYNSGTAQPKLNQESIQSITLLTPNNPVERLKIADILSTWDEAINLIIDTITETKKLHSILSKLLTNTDFLIAHFHSNVDIFTIAEILDYEHPNKYIPNLIDPIASNVIPVLTANKSFIIGSTAETEKTYNDVPVIIFDDFTTDSKYVDFPFSVRSSAIKILKAKPTMANTRYIYELIKSIEVNHDVHKRYYISQYSNIQVPIPPVDVQNQIANIFMQMDKQLLLLEGKLVQIKKQKQGLMQQLLTGKIRVKVS